MRRCLGTCCLIFVLTGVMLYGGIYTYLNHLPPWRKAQAEGEEASIDGGDGGVEVHGPSAKPGTAIGGRRGAGHGAEGSVETEGGNKALPKDGGVGAGAPPDSEEKIKTMKAMLLFGCFLTVVSFCTPIIVYWSLGSSWKDTISFHNTWDLVASALSCFAWALFGIAQLHQENGMITDITAVALNIIGVTVYVLFLVIKGANGKTFGKKGCVGAVLAFLCPVFVIVCFMVYGPVTRNSAAAVWISFIATLVQVISQALPLCSMIVQCVCRVDQPEPNDNIKKLIIHGRFWNLIVSGFWAWYCICSYSHTFYEVANIVSTVFALMSLMLHLTYALEPQAVRHGHRTRAG